MHTGRGRNEGEGEGWRDGAGRRKVARGAGTGLLSGEIATAFASHRRRATLNTSTTSISPTAAL